MPLYGAGSGQPLDSDLTAIAALSTTSYGRALLELADAGAGRTALGLGTAATHAHGDYEVAGAAAAAQAASQPVDSDLTSIAALTTTAYGRALLENADAAAVRTYIGAAPGTVGGPSLVIRKTGDETVNNSSTLQDDDHLLLPVAATDIWFIEAFLLTNAASVNADWKFGWSFPSGATAKWGIHGQASTVTGATWQAVAAGAAAQGVRAIGGVATVGAVAADAGFLLAGWFFVGANAGNIGLAWAQNTPTVEDSKVLTNSFLRGTRLA